MYQNPSSNFKYVSLDLSYLNQKKKNARQAMLERQDYTYAPEFNIQNSWLPPGRGDALKDSMLAYSKRMSDIQRIRGINSIKHLGQPSATPSLWISTGKGSLHINMVDDRKYYTPHNRMTKSLGSIKLEPLLGSKRTVADTDMDPNSYLQTHKVVKEVRPSRVHEEPPLKIKHITVTITIPPPEIQQGDEEEEEEAEAMPAVVKHIEHEGAQAKKKLIPLGNGRARPRKAKRMKIAGPDLESIDEDADEISAHTQVMEESYSDLLNDLHNSQELMLEQKRRAVALLKQTNYAQRSYQQSRQLAMTTLAKRKIRKLPPIPMGKPSLRYTSGKGGSSSPYDDRTEDPKYQSD